MSRHAKLFVVLCLAFSQRSTGQTVEEAVVDVGSGAAKVRLLESCAFHVSFDNATTHADLARGDGRIFSAKSKRGLQNDNELGLPMSRSVVLESAGGVKGGCLRFTGQTKEIVFYKADGNLGYRPENWSGACSFWLKLAPDQDLPSTFSDPVQWSGPAAADGHIFTDFSDRPPRTFSFGIKGVSEFWNPQQLPWNELPNPPAATVKQPRFTRDRWTHVAFNYAGINSGKPSASGQLFLDGIQRAEFSQSHQVFRWEVQGSVLILGINFVGLFDELAVFDRTLTAVEVMHLYHAQGDWESSE